MEKTYTVSIRFLENGHECKTSWTGPATSRSEAISKAYSWFGFAEDGIVVLATNVEEVR